MVEKLRSSQATSKTGRLFVANIPGGGWPHQMRMLHLTGKLLEFTTSVVAASMLASRNCSKEQFSIFIFFESTLAACISAHAATFFPGIKVVMFNKKIHIELK